MLYSGILLQHKERHTELHVSKAIISWLYFPVSAVHHQPINLPNWAYPNWPIHTPRKCLCRMYHLFLFFFFWHKSFHILSAKFFTTQEFRDASLYKHQCLFFHRVNYNNSQVPATALLLQQTSLLSLRKAPA